MAKVKKGQVIHTPGKVYREGDTVPDELIKEPKDLPKEIKKERKKDK